MSATGAVLERREAPIGLQATRSLPEAGWPAFPAFELGARPSVLARRDGRQGALAAGLTLLLAAAAAWLPRVIVSPPPPPPMVVNVVIAPPAPPPLPELQTPEAPTPELAAPVVNVEPPPINPAPLTRSVVPDQPAPRLPAPTLVVPKPPPPRPAAKPRPATPATVDAAPAIVAPPTVVPTPAAPATPNPGEVAAFQASMRQAVRAALIYPPAARLAGQKGEVRVAFDYLDGMASNVALGISSGLPLLDRAAVATVQAARYGPPPATLAHRAMHLSILVQFDPSR